MVASTWSAETAWWSAEVAVIMQTTWVGEVEFAVGRITAWDISVGFAKVEESRRRYDPQLRYGLEVVVVPPEADQCHSYFCGRSLLAVPFPFQHAIISRHT